MSDGKTIWEGALAEIELSVSRANFNTWFKNTFVSRHESGVVYLCVPNAFAKDWLAAKYHKSILRALRNKAPGVRNVEYIISKNNHSKPTEIVFEEKVFQDQLRLQDLDANNDDGLNPKYTFDNFVVGSFNELGYAAAQAILKNPGMAYNPLFIYGGTGVGKTHLIQAIGNQIKKIDKHKKVYYLTSEKFTVEYVDAVQNKKIHLFKEKYKKYDTFIMDDVQFVSGKDMTQEELFHLFNHLYENNKQIIFSSDKPPKSIGAIEARLRSRFEGGMTIDISKPDFESRLAILKNKVLLSQTNTPLETLEFVASIIQDNIRELEGVLNSIICQSQLKKRDLSILEVKLLIKNSIKPQRVVSIKDVIKTVSDFYNIEERVLYEKTRKKEVVRPRQVIMYILREDLNTSYPHIGQKLGGRDHTTVIHAYEKIKKDIKENQTLNQEIEQIKNILYNDPQKIQQ